MFMLSLAARGEYYQVFADLLFGSFEADHFQGLPRAGSWYGVWPVVTLLAVTRCHRSLFPATKSTRHRDCRLGKNHQCV